MKKLLFIIPLLLFFINVNAEEYQYMDITKTSLHTYISDVNMGTSSCSIFFESPTYRQITGSENQYTWTMTQASSPKMITRLAYNVFGNFQRNSTYRINWEVKWPNNMLLDEYTCSIGSYTQNTAFPSYSMSSCTIKRSDNGYVMLSGEITIEQGQYVSFVITPKVGIDTDHTYCGNELPTSIITKTFTLSYGTPKVMKMIGYGSAIQDSTNTINNTLNNQTNAINNQTGAINNQTNAINNQTNSINNQTNVINNQTNKINNTISDDSVSNPTSDIADFNNFVASNSTISSLITLPVSLFTKVLDSLNSSCSSYDLGEFRGSHIILPCINISNYIGSTLFSVIDVLISGIFVYNISRKFVKVFENMSSMKDGDIIG